MIKRGGARGWRVEREDEAGNRDMSIEGGKIEKRGVVAGGSRVGGYKRQTTLEGKDQNTVENGNKSQ
jgi:hypothetical protein